MSKLHSVFSIEIPHDRNYGLDIVRAMAILFVVFHHGNHLISPLISARTTIMLSLDGVSIFFVLSGFLIGGILIKTVKTNGSSPPVLMHFWIRRWFRTLPNYFFVLTLICLLRIITKSLPDNIIEFYLFVQNFAKPHPLFFAEAWSLSVEEWFYLLYPLTLFLIVRLTGLSVDKALLMVALIFIATSVGIRTYRYFIENMQFVHHWSDFYRKQVATRMDSLMIGVLGAYFHQFVSVHATMRVIFLIFGFLIMYSGNLLQYFQPIENEFLKAYYFIFYFSSEAVGALMVLPFFLHIKKGEGRFYRFFTTISLISYSMYLLHLTLVSGYMFMTIDMILDPKESIPILITKYLVYWSVTFLSSLLLYKYFEIPCTALRRHFPLHRIEKLWLKLSKRQL